MLIFIISIYIMNFKEIKDKYKIKHNQIKKKMIL